MVETPTWQAGSESAYEARVSTELTCKIGYVFYAPEN